MKPIIHERKKIFIYSILFIMIAILFSLYPSTEAFGASSKTVTVKKEGYYSKDKLYGPDTIEYNEDGYAGTLNRTKIRWMTRTLENGQRWVTYSNKRSNLDKSITRKYDKSFFEDYYEGKGYDNVNIQKLEWVSDIFSSGPYYNSGKSYKYKRRFWVDYSYTSYCHVSTYEGMVYKLNDPPELINISLDNDRLYHENATISVTGKVKDSDLGDNIEIKFYINNNYVKSITIDSTTGNEQYFSTDILLTEKVNLGENTLKVQAIDSEGEKSNSIEKTLNIRNVIKDIDENVVKYMPENLTENDLRVVLIHTDDNISNTTNNDVYSTSLLNNLLKRNSKTYFIGRNGTTKNFIENKITRDYGITDNNNGDNITEFIISKLSKLDVKDTNIFTVGDYIENNVMFEDIERDYKNLSVSEKVSYKSENDDFPEEFRKPKNSSLKIKYTHDPQIFDNPVPKSPKDKETWEIITSMDAPFVIKEGLYEYRGEWQIEIIASDDTGKDKFDLETEMSSYSFIIHDRPKAIIKSSVTPDQIILAGGNSYDVDYQYSLPNNGIVKYLWKYQLENGNWYEAGNDKNLKIETKIKGQTVINYSLTVWDSLGASDTVIETIEKSEELLVELYGDIFPEETKFNIMDIPSTEKLKVINIETIAPVIVNHVYFAIYDNNTRKTNNIILTNPTNIVNTDGVETIWKSIRNIKIPPLDIYGNYLSDGDYVAKLTARTSENIGELKQPIVIKTPVNLETTTPKEIIGDSETTLKAITSKYVESIKIKIFEGKPYEKVINIDDSQSTLIEGNKKEWLLMYDVPSTIPEGNYSAEYIATTYNGETQSKKDSFFLQTLLLENFRITKIVNHDTITFPYTKDDLLNKLIDYKSGYKVVFRIDAKGNPNETIAQIFKDMSMKYEINMTNVENVGNSIIYEGSFYTDAKIDNGTIISINLTARKGGISYDYNLKNLWNNGGIKSGKTTGKLLEINGSALQDGRINRID